MSPLSNISIGQYHHGNSLLHRLDPRTKLMAMVLMVISVSFAREPIGFLFICLFLGIGIFLSHLPFRLILGILRRMLWLFISIMTLHILFSDKETGFIFFPVSLKDLWAGLLSGAIVGCRFILIVLGAGIITLTTIPLRLADALSRLLNPLSKIGIPLHQFPIMTVVVLHFIPMFFAEAEKLILVQKARGVNLENQNIFRRYYNLLPILAPLLKNAFRRADELAIGMESRCYKADARTQLYPLSFNKNDIVSLSLFVMLIPIVLAINRFM
jgi:energy-coupling factor transport system permease protein